jgi:hypothetical protein
MAYFLYYPCSLNEYCYRDALFNIKDIFIFLPIRGEFPAFKISMEVNYLNIIK